MQIIIQLIYRRLQIIMQFIYIPLQTIIQFIDRRMQIMIQFIYRRLQIITECAGVLQTTMATMVDRPAHRRVGPTIAPTTASFFFSMYGCWAGFLWQASAISVGHQCWPLVLAIGLGLGWHQSFCSTTAAHLSHHHLSHHHLSHGLTTCLRALAHAHACTCVIFFCVCLCLCLCLCLCVCFVFLSVRAFVVVALLPDIEDPSNSTSNQFLVFHVYEILVKSRSDVAM